MKANYLISITFEPRSGWIVSQLRVIGIVKTQGNECKGLILV